MLLREGDRSRVLSGGGEGSGGRRAGGEGW